MPRFVVLLLQWRSVIIWVTAVSPPTTTIPDVYIHSHCIHHFIGSMQFYAHNADGIFPSPNKPTEHCKTVTGTRKSTKQNHHFHCQWQRPPSNCGARGSNSILHVASSTFVSTSRQPTAAEERKPTLYSLETSCFRSLASPTLCPCVWSGPGYSYRCRSVTVAGLSANPQLRFNNTGVLITQCNGRTNNSCVHSA